jgi:predicted transcriptional regulator
MTDTTKELLDKISSWPREDQEELAQYAREIEARRTGVYQLSDAEQQGIERGLKAMREGKFASDERVAAILKRARSSHT